MRAGLLSAGLGLLLLSAGGSGCAGSVATQEQTGGWSPGSSPGEIGKRVAERFVSSPHANFGRPAPPKSITYPESCTWYGALAFARRSGDTLLESRLVRRFEPLLDSAASSLVPVPNHVDRSVFGIVPLQISIQRGDERCRRLGKRIADAQWEHGRAGNLSPQTRFWIDDMFMITALQVQAFRATGDRKYLDRAADEMVVYLDTLQRPNGLFYHAPDVPVYWGRGNGWVAAGMAELLCDLPENHPHRTKVLDGFRRMMATLVRLQDSTGMWRQILDREDSWRETSCTGMFTFALITGVRHGFLARESCESAARRGWRGLLSYIDSNGDVHEVCEGTNRKNDIRYYLDRKRLVGDLHGQAPVLWCASAWLGGSPEIERTMNTQQRREQ